MAFCPEGRGVFIRSYIPKMNNKLSLLNHTYEVSTYSSFFETPGEPLLDMQPPSKTE